MQRKIKFILGAFGAIIIVLAILFIIGILINKNASNISLPKKGELFNIGALKSTPSYDSYTNADQRAENLSAESAEERMVIRSGEIDMVVKDVRKSEESLKTLVTSSEGLIISSTINELKEGDLLASITLKVPVQAFDAILSEIRNLGIKIVSESFSGEDVTEEYQDLDAELKNREALENQFLEVLKKAENISDIIAVQQQLSYVRSEIDRLKGRIQYLERNVEMASIRVTLSTDSLSLPVTEQNQWQLAGVARLAVKGFILTLHSLVTALIWVTVFIPLWAPILLVIRFIIKKRRT
ncbi:DUF4349 domain-containing protein [Candidatus Peregrinibacteria bacterium]|nr:DUF4349 domain-containing protein [Candidatus Peregrinibacteria bacterium]